MKKALVMFFLFGLTFIYNPSTGKGFVYLNQSSMHAVIILNTEEGVYTHYTAIEVQRKQFDEGLSSWIKQIYEHPENVESIRSVISPLWGTR